MKENNGNVLKRGIIMRLDLDYTFTRISYKSPNEVNIEYKEFYEWLLINCNNDKEDVKRKELLYIVESYIELKNLINDKVQNDKSFVNVLQLTTENKHKLSDYLVQTKEDYDFLSRLPLKDRDYKFYTNLLSWYSFTIDTTDRVVMNLYKISLRTKQKQRSFKEYHYIDWYEETDELSYEIKEVHYER